MVGEEGRTVLQAASLLGREFDWTLLPPACELESDRALKSLQAASELSLVEADRARGFRFRHDLTRDAVLATMSGPLRSYLAVRLLGAVEHDHPDLEGPWPFVAAGLADEAGDPGRAADHLTRSGREAVARSALAIGRAAFGRATTLVTGTLVTGTLVTGDVVRTIIATDELVRVLARAGDVDEAARVERSLEAIEDKAPPAVTEHAPARRANAQIQIARAGIERAQLQQAAVAVGVAGATQGSSNQAELDVVRAQISMGVGDLDAAREHAGRAHASLRRGGRPDLECEAAVILGHSLHDAEPDAAEAMLVRVLETARTNGLLRAQAQLCRELGHIDAVRRLVPGRLFGAYDLAHRAGALDVMADVDSEIALVLGAAWNRRPALAHAVRGVEVARQLANPRALPIAFVALGLALAIADDADGLATARAAYHVLADRPAAADMRWHGDVEATAALLHEDRQGALEHLERAAGLAAACAVSPQSTAGPMSVLLRAAAANGDDGANTRPDAPVSAMVRSPVAAGLLLVADAVASGHVGRSARAADQMAAAEVELQRAGTGNGHHFLALRVAAEAAIDDRWGAPIDWLARVSAWSGANGFAAIERASRRLLGRAGAPVPRKGRGMSSVPQSLAAMRITSREVDVLRLIAQGLTNKEVASRLYISPRTVATHVEHLLAKTKQERRAGLRAFASDHGVES